MSTVTSAIIAAVIVTVSVGIFCFVIMKANEFSRRNKQEYEDWCRNFDARFPPRR